MGKKLSNDVYNWIEFQTNLCHAFFSQAENWEGFPNQYLKQCNL